MDKSPVRALSIPRETKPRESSLSPVGHSPNAHTGRPTMWTKSTLRKMARLYVYTTLPLQKILDVIHHNTPSGVPGTDSANKNLNSLLDKEPRWLKPRDVKDMGRRVDQLSQSCTRLYPQSPASGPDHTASHSRSTSDPISAPCLPANIKEERGISPVLLEVPTPQWANAPSASSPSSPMSRVVRSQPCSPAGTLMTPKEAREEVIFAPFLRRTTIMSSSTDSTTDSLQSILSEYTKPYIRVIKRLVRRFTGPTNSQISSSPASDRTSAVMDWLADDTAPQGFDGRPYPLPGDFLLIEMHANLHTCRQDDENHYNRRCLCPAIQDIQESPWVSSLGMTPKAIRILSGCLEANDFRERDAFNNSVLHLLAARGTIYQLYAAVALEIPLSLLKQTNAAGQTFLHVLRPEMVDDMDMFCGLIRLAQDKAVHVYSADHYGRTVFHTLQALGVSPATLYKVQQLCGCGIYAKRDAFGVRVVAPGGISHVRQTHSMIFDAMDLDQPSTSGSSEPSLRDEKISIEGDYLRKVRHASEDPSFEDGQGRNGLHCLAFATLSLGSVEEKLHLGLDFLNIPNWKKLNRQLDSSRERLLLRQQLVQHLLTIGADPNHYDYDGNTPLMAFAAQLPEDGDYKLGPDILRMLIDHGANIHARNRAGETALHIAVRCGRKLAAKTLAKAGANVNARDSMGRTTLDLADAKISSAKNDRMKDYVRFEACRAWLSGSAGCALQNPSVLDEWGTRSPV